MQRSPILVLAVVSVALGPAGPTHAASPFVASLTITTPSDSVAAQARVLVRSERLTAHASPGRASLLSIGATTLPVAAGLGLLMRSDNQVVGAWLIGGGVLLGPAVGYFDAGLNHRGTRGLALRMLAASLTAGGLYAAAAGSAGLDEVDSAGMVVVFLAGSAATGTLAILDCATVGSHVARAGRTSMSIAPAVSPASGVPGVGVRVRF